MLHPPFATITGTIEDFERMAGALRKLKGTLANCYRRRTGQSEATVSKWLADETWFDAGESVTARLADAIDEAAPIAAAARAVVDLSRFRNVPPTISRSAAAAAWDRVINQQSGGVPRRPGPASGPPASPNPAGDLATRR